MTLSKTQRFLPSAVVTALLLFAPRPARGADPTTAECLAANNASIDLRNDHKLRAARDQLLVCAAASCPADVRKECLRRVDETNAAIPTIIFEAKDGSGKDVSAVKVTMDGAVLAERLEGTSLAVDPGDHTFVFETEGQPAVQKQFVLRQGEKDRRELVSLGGAPPVTPPPSPCPGGSERTAAGECVRSGPNVEPGGSGLGTQRILALVAGGVGVAGVALGSVFGLVAISKKNSANDVCPNQCATQDGVSKWSDAKSAGNVSTVGFIIGGVGLAAGAVLWFTAKPESGGSSTPAVGLGPGSIQVKGTW